MSEDTSKQQNTTHVTPKHRKTLTGVVVSDKMTDTIVVAVTRYVKHPKYKKYVKRVKRHKADDKGNNHKVGETVTIIETRPISKTKSFKVLNS